MQNTQLHLPLYLEYICGILIITQPKKPAHKSFVLQLEYKMKLVAFM